jgi:hypothetical protein
MENEINVQKPTRSIGVTLWALFFISSILGLINIRHPLMNTGHMFVYVCLCVAYAVCGIALFRLKEIGRQGAIALGVLSIVTLPFLIDGPIQQLRNEQIYTKWRQEVVTAVAPEKQQENLDAIDKIQGIVEQHFPRIRSFFIIFVMVPMVILLLIQIWFFTRPKVKEQFE